MYKGYNAAGHGPAFKRNSRAFGGAFMGGYRRPKHNVPVNIDEKPGYFEVLVYATGFDKSDIKLSAAEDVLYITGTRTVTTEPNFTMQEFPVKSFERMIGLNGKVDSSAITARQENGILIITLPKTKEAQQPAQEIKVD